MNRLAWLLPKILRKRWGLGCYTCGTTQYFGYPGPDENGEKVYFCVDCWPGYESCGFIGCDHYQCEHVEGMCGNAGCNCTGFITKNERDRLVSDFGHAARNVFWVLSEMEGVKEVRSEVEMVVRVTVHADNFDSREAREKLYEAQSKLMHEHPDVVFDFILR